MVKAPAYGAGDSRFESWCDRSVSFLIFSFFFIYLSPTLFYAPVQPQLEWHIARRILISEAISDLLGDTMPEHWPSPVCIRLMFLVEWTEGSVDGSTVHSNQTTSSHLGKRERERELERGLRSSQYMHGFRCR